MPRDATLSDAADPFFNARESAKHLNISEPTFWKGVASGWLPKPAYITPKSPRWRRSWLDAAAEGKRILPREAVAERRARKLARSKKGEIAAAV
jgi:predicted DNA-binding transcriptional regulator AlpA